MEEKRRFNRWDISSDGMATVSYDGGREQVEILDISTGGMRVNFGKAMDIGQIVYGEFKILPQVGPFFIRGKIVRAFEHDGSWETSVAFEKVSSIPLQ
jgi:hypothetical protein